MTTAPPSSRSNVGEKWRLAPTFEQVVRIDAPALYVPGEFYRRELPCIQRALEGLARAPSVIVIDGFVWLDAAGKRALGAHLWDHLARRAVIVGVAKSPLRQLPPCTEVLGGESKKPLSVSAAGMTSEDAARRIMGMLGAYRMPTLLRRVDQLTRQR